MSTEQRTVIVTGASGGLGQSIVSVLLTEGYKVVGVSRRDQTQEFLDVYTDNYSHICHDLSDLANISTLVREIKGSFDGILGLINNAAVGKDGILPTLHNNDITYQINLNLTSPILLTKYISREMLAFNRGRVINISSVVANSGYRGLSVYAATKAGLEGFTRSFSREVGTRGITVNCVAPGFMETEMTASLTEEQLTRIQNRSALKRFPTISEVAAAVKFLLSDEATGITGTCITVDAGNTA